MTSHETKQLNSISQAIFDKKGFNILVLDVRGISSMTDYFIIAEGSVGRHLKALSSILKDKAEEIGVRLCRIEGEGSEGWIALDFSDIVIHLFTPEMREKYAFEEVWKKAKIVDVKIITEKHSKSDC